MPKIQSLSQLKKGKSYEGGLELVVKIRPFDDVAAAMSQYPFITSQHVTRFRKVAEADSADVLAFKEQAPAKNVDYIVVEKARRYGPDNVVQVSQYRIYVAPVPTSEKSLAAPLDFGSDSDDDNELKEKSQGEEDEEQEQDQDTEDQHAQTVQSQPSRSKTFKKRGRDALEEEDSDEPHPPHKRQKTQSGVAVCEDKNGATRVIVETPVVLPEYPGDCESSDNAKEAMDVDDIDEPLSAKELMSVQAQQSVAKQPVKDSKEKPVIPTPDVLQTPCTRSHGGRRAKSTGGRRLKSLLYSCINEKANMAQEEKAVHPLSCYDGVDAPQKYPKSYMNIARGRFCNIFIKGDYKLLSVRVVDKSGGIQLTGFDVPVNEMWAQRVRQKELMLGKVYEIRQFAVRAHSGVYAKRQTEKNYLKLMKNTQITEVTAPKAAEYPHLTDTELASMRIYQGFDYLRLDGAEQANAAMILVCIEVPEAQQTHGTQIQLPVFVAELGEAGQEDTSGHFKMKLWGDQISLFGFQCGECYFFYNMTLNTNYGNTLGTQQSSKIFHIDNTFSVESVKIAAAALRSEWIEREAPTADGTLADFQSWRQNQPTSTFEIANGIDIVVAEDNYRTFTIRNHRVYDVEHCADGFYFMNDEDQKTMVEQSEVQIEFAWELELRCIDGEDRNENLVVSLYGDNNPLLAEHFPRFEEPEAAFHLKMSDPAQHQRLCDGVRKFEWGVFLRLDNAALLLSNAWTV